LTTGGECSIFEILKEIKKALKNYPTLQEEVEKNLKPDFFKL